jgi:HTH-type transcriptional regulator, sugar sensing transcriptional regulator
LDVAPLLEDLGLSKTEARVYLTLLSQSPLPAPTIADLTGTSRSSVYLVLRSLVDKGLIDAGAGYSSRYHAAPPERALAGLLEQDRTALENRERQVRRALPELSELFEQNKASDGEIVEILRTPKLVGERFDRLQAEAERTIDVVIRGPVQIGGPNEAEVAALHRGVRARAIYDSALLADASVAPHLAGWTAEGEQARVYHGELPLKFALFDGHTVVMPLVAPGVTGVVALIVRSRELAGALGLLFETLWAGSEPLELELPHREREPEDSGRMSAGGLAASRG